MKQFASIQPRDVAGYLSGLPYFTASQQVGIIRRILVRLFVRRESHLGTVNAVIGQLAADSACVSSEALVGNSSFGTTRSICRKEVREGRC